MRIDGIAPGSRIAMFQLVFALAGVACGNDDPHGSIGRVVSFTAPALPSLDELPYPKNEDGTYTLIRAGNAALVIDPERRNPVWTMDICSTWLRACYAPPKRTMDDCYRSAPRCTSERAWEKREVCCPQACFDDYVARRKGGAEQLAAWLEVNESHRCYPGVEQFLATGEAP